MHQSVGAGSMELSVAIPPVSDEKISLPVTRPTGAAQKRRPRPLAMLKSHCRSINGAVMTVWQHYLVFDGRTTNSSSPSVRLGLENHGEGTQKREPKAKKRWKTMLPIGFESTHPGQCQCGYRRLGHKMTIVMTIVIIMPLPPWFSLSMAVFILALSIRIYDRRPFWIVNLIGHGSTQSTDFRDGQFCHLNPRIFSERRGGGVSTSVRPSWWLGDTDSKDAPAISDAFIAIFTGLWRPRDRN